MARITVLMCVYNGQQVLTQAIDSVLNDSYENYEFIIVNDGSTDGTKQILDKYERQDHRIKIINKENSGLTSSLNVGLREARGEYIARLDADDYMLPGRLLEQEKYLNEHSDIALVGANAWLINKHGRPIGKTSSGSLSHSGCVNILNKTTSCFAHSSWMVRRDVMLALGGYDEFYKKAQDYDFLLRCTEKYKIACMPNYLIALRKDRSTISYDTRFCQYKYGVVARLQKFLRTNPEYAFQKSKEELMTVVDRWFTDIGLANKMLAQQHLSFARYDIKAGLLVDFLQKVLDAFKADPMCIFNRARLTRIRENPLRTLLPYLSCEYL